MKIVAVLLLIASANFAAQAQSSSSKFKFAKSFEESGDFETAARLFKELHEKYPNNANYFDGVVRNLKAQNKFSKLAPIVKKQLERDETVKNYALLGELYWKLGKVDSANSVWEKAIDLSPELKSTYQTVAESQMNAQQFPKAIKAYLEGRDNLDKHDVFANELSELYIIAGDYKKGMEEILTLFYKTRDLALAQGRISALLTSPNAKQYVGEVLKEETEDRPNSLIMKIYAWYLRTIGELNKAFEIYKELDEKLNTGGKEVINFANSSRKDAQYDIALKAYEHIISMDKQSKYLSSALYGYPRALEQKTLTGSKLSPEDAERIIERYREIIRRFPQNNLAKEARYRIATISTQFLDDNETAKKELSEIIHKYPNSSLAAKALNLLAEIAVSEGKLKEAYNIYKKTEKEYARINANESIKAEYGMAEILFYQKGLDSAQNSFARLASNTDSDVANDALEKAVLIDDNKDMIKALNTYAKAELNKRQNKIDSALKLYLYSADLGEGKDLAERSLLDAAKLYYKKADYESGLKSLNRLLENYPKSIYKDEALLLISQFHEKQKDKESAINALTQLITEYPNSIYLEEARQKIRKLRD